MKFVHFGFVEREDGFHGTGGNAGAVSMHFRGCVSISADSNSGSSFRGWMQSTGHTSTQAESLVPMQGSQMMYANYPSKSLIESSLARQIRPSSRGSA